jgi:hypothetical protein
MLLLEVDKSLRNNLASLEVYQAKANEIRAELAKVGMNTLALRLGFCRVGEATAKDLSVCEQLGFALVADFPEPSPPRLRWL